MNEHLIFCSQYLLEIETKYNRQKRNVDALNDRYLVLFFVFFFLSNNSSIRKSPAT